ncbi:hypothetical protein A2U01_0116658, partial [Trifolium medium]|nr:hypothetical protein [Trifolium medium]
ELSMIERCHGCCKNQALIPDAGAARSNLKHTHAVIGAVCALSGLEA